MNDADKTAVRLSLLLVFTVIFFVYVFWWDQWWHDIAKTQTTVQTIQQTRPIADEIASQDVWFRPITAQRFVQTWRKETDKQLISLAVLGYEPQLHFVDVYGIHRVYIWSSMDRTWVVLTWARISSVGLYGQSITYINERIRYPRTVVMFVRLSQWYRLIQSTKETYDKRKRYIRTALKELDKR